MVFRILDRILTVCCSLATACAVSPEANRSKVFFLQPRHYLCCISGSEVASFWTILSPVLGLLESVSGNKTREAIMQAQRSQSLLSWFRIGRITFGVYNIIIMGCAILADRLKVRHGSDSIWMFLSEHGLPELKYLYL